MESQIKFKPTYDVGYIGHAKTGEKFEIVGYNGRKNIIITFDCGHKKNTTSTHIKNCNVSYKLGNRLTFLGDTLTHKSGMSCKVISYKKDSEITVLFENGIVKDGSYSGVLNGRVCNNVPLQEIKEGGTFGTTRYGDVVVKKYSSATSIDVMFSDGTVVSTCASALRRGNIGHPKSGIPEGFSFINSDGVRGEVHKFHSHSSVEILWDDGVITQGHRAIGVRRGSIYYPNFKSVVGIGYFGIGKYKPNKSGKNINYNSVVYQKWVQMIVRCYNPYEINKDSCKAYRDVFVCDEWHNFQNFALWADTNIEKFVDGFELDKDMFGNGYLYCPEFCTILPDQVNGFLSDNYSNKTSGLPEGVTVIKPKKNATIGYVARCTIKGKREYLCFYKTPQEAGKTYRIAKEGEARRLADEYKHILTEREYNKLYSFTLSDIHRK